jgi:hypothetical protein
VPCHVYDNQFFDKSIKRHYKVTVAVAIAIAVVFGIE